ncbi:uncharacterized protein LOC119675491 [Teleopsis dalmanni]|uniref:uncharacterized protein LOC119675491 n=1 Tax=Teleopsis dalmanni TaxID=139649 RepID=UPI0018CD83E4|nr:uncharacterized protein LOC119675491 [Teleopsis dalmanni]
MTINALIMPRKSLQSYRNLDHEMRGTSSDFVTTRRNAYWLRDYVVDSETESNDIYAESEVDKSDKTRIAERYSLRFSPILLQSKIFLHNSPQMNMVNSGPTVIPESTTLKEETTTEKDITTTVLPITSTTILPPDVSTTSSKPTTSTISTTMKTVIMKPINPFPTALLPNKLKNILVYGSAAKLNLFHRRPGTAIKNKSKGFLSLFEVIKFENSKCEVEMGDIRTMHGVCYHEFECKSLGGIPTESCAGGVGVCCIFLTSCGDSTNEAVVYFESPNYPNPVREMMICVLIVNLRKNVQQLRLDLLMFEINRPTDGDCIDDQFIVSGQNINFAVPVLCGINTGEHIYIHVGNSLENKIYLSFFAKVPTGGRSFNIKITQLEDNLAPEGCLQYYTDTTGVVKSFNYDIEGTIVENKEATYLNNLNYAICMQRAKDYCTVTYTMEQLGGEQLDFQIINKDEESNDLVPDGQAGAGIFNCPDDFLAINQVRLCGERFNDGTEIEDFSSNAPIKDISAGPIILPFRSDAEYVGRGFRLAYKQDACLQ